MLNRARVIGIISVLMGMSSCSKKDSPAIMYPELSIDDESLTHLPTPQEEAEIIQFVKTIRGIDHRVQEIAVKSPTQVEVKTGRVSPEVVHLRQAGNQMRISERGVPAAAGKLHVEASLRVIGNCSQIIAEGQKSDVAQIKAGLRQNAISQLRRPKR